MTLLAAPPPPANKTRKPLRASFAGATNHHAHFPQATAQLTISVGQPVHEGERLKAAVMLINRSFARCKIMIDDSIQWYTLAIDSKNTDKATLLENAIQAGDHYLARNQAIFESFLTIPYEIIRWKNWLNTSEWQEAITEMHRHYANDPILHQAINQNATTFLTRYAQRQANERYDPVYARDLCIQYLLEECAVMKTLWITLGCHYEIYPSGRNEAMTATYEHYIKPFYPDLLQSIGLRFHRRSGAI